MKLEKKIKDKCEYGDQKAIAEKTGLSIGTVNNAFRNSRGSRKTIAAISDYYETLNQK